MRWTRPRTLLQFVMFVSRSFLQNNGFETAKSLTFTSLFAVVPLITLVLAILSVFPSFQVFGERVQALIFTRLLPSSSSELQGYLAEFTQHARNLTWVGAGMLFVTAYLMLRNIESTFNQIWGVGEQRKGLATFLLYWSVLSLGPLLLGVGLAISSYISSLQLYIRFTTVPVIFGARRALLSGFPLVLTTGAFTLLYAAVPNCGVRIRHAFAGALAVALGFSLVKWVFTRFIAAASYQIVYGTFATIPIFLLWIYVCWTVILIGANLVRSIPLFTTHNTVEHVHPTLLLLALLHKFWEKHQRGEVLHVQELLDEKWPFRSLPVERLMSLLEELNLIRMLSRDEYLLTRDMETVTLWEVLGAVPWAHPRPEDLAKPVPPVVARHLPDSSTLKDHFVRMAELSGQEFSSTFNAYFRDETAWVRRSAAMDGWSAEPVRFGNRLFRRH